MSRRHLRDQLLLDDLRIARRNVRRVASTDTTRTVHQQHRQHRCIPLRLHRKPIIIAVLQHIEVVHREQLANARLQIGVDITGRRRILTALNAGTELSLRNQPRDIVGSHEVLRHSHDGLIQRRLTVVVPRVLRHVSCELGHANLLGQIPLERCIQNLPLRRLQSVHHIRNRPLEIVVAEVNQILVHELIVLDHVSRRNQSRVVVRLEPGLAVIGTLLVERQINRRIGLRRVVELHCIHLAEVVLGLVACRRTQSLVVLDLPRSGSASAPTPILPFSLTPLLVLVLRVEDLHIHVALGSSACLRCLHNRRRHVRQESRNRNQLVPQLVEQVDQQTADVTAVKILIGHDHDRPIPQVCGVLVLLTGGQSDDLLQLRDLLGLLHLRVTRVLDVQHLALEWVDAEGLALLLAQTAESHGLR